METILITGAGGMIAKKLKNILAKDFHLKFLTRNPMHHNEFKWDIENNFIDPRALEDIQHIVHLAGVSIGEKRWTDKQKKAILDSRIKSAEMLLNAIKKKNISLKSYLSASAVGYYGTITTDEIFTENSPAGNDFLSQVCQKWEQSAEHFSEISDRVLKLRFGVVISTSGGVLRKMLTPAKYNLNAIVGTGRQIIPWIDIEDLCSIISYCLQNENTGGVYNAVSPNPVTNADFTTTLGKVLGKKILLPPIPEWLVKIMFGEVSVLLLEGSKVSAQKIIDAGFTFQYPNLENCLMKELKTENLHQNPTPNQ